MSLRTVDSLRGLRRRRHDTRHGLHVALPARLLGAQGPAAGWREAVELGTLALLRGAPVGLDPAALLHAVKRGIEGAVENAEAAARALADEPRDGVAVHRS